MPKKFKSKRGMTLVEVVTVVALLAIVLGLAVPNLVAESERIKMTALNGYARSVAVALQSEMYGMKNSGTVEDSEYAALISNSSNSMTMGEGEKAREVRYIANFGAKHNVLNAFLIKWGLTDDELLQKGKIVVVYDVKTADILEVFYSEKEFEAANVFPVVEQEFLNENHIGVYLGEGAPEIQRRTGLPRLYCEFKWDDELYLNMKVLSDPSSQLDGKKLGLEIYAMVPNDAGGTDEIGIYYQGIFDTDYQTEDAGTIKADYGHCLKAQDLKKGNDLKFALDSLVTDRASWGNVKDYLRHQSKPNYVSVAETYLYPREALKNWFDPKVNPYITFWYT